MFVVKMSLWLRRQVQGKVSFHIAMFVLDFYRQYGERDLVVLISLPSYFPFGFANERMTDQVSSLTRKGSKLLIWAQNRG